MARIVVVDDDPDIVTLVRLSLEALGHVVEEASNGQEALAAVKSIRPDLVLMDMMMPGVNGYEATASLKEDETTRSIPILALTAKAMRGDEEKGREAGVDAYITKPFRISEVVDAVSSFL